MPELAFGCVVVVVVFILMRFTAIEANETGNREGFKRGWIAGIDYAKNHKDGV